MSSEETGDHQWTLCGLVKAFVDLSLAYLLLCLSTIAFFASLFLSLFSLNLPCFCRGFFAYRNADLCWHRLLFDWPLKKTYQVLSSAKSKFPFDERDQSRFDFDVKGKSKSKGVNPKQRSLIRRRRRVSSLSFGKFATVFPSDGLGCSEDKLGETSRVLSEHEFGPLDDVDMPRDNYRPIPLGVENFDNGSEERPERVKALERALEEARTACSALYLELEKERASAATAADEAMAMISRLQTHKASMEVEARQYQRLIEEKFAYDEDEIGILKEILVRREKDNLFLEKEVEAYRRMSVTGDEGCSNDDISDTTTLDDLGHRLVYTPCKPDFVEKRSLFDGHELVEKTVILVDRAECNAAIDSVPEDMNNVIDGR